MIFLMHPRSLTVSTPVPHLVHTRFTPDSPFRYLARLLLVHGRSSYKRNSEIVMYSFYKNWVMNVTYLIYAFASGVGMCGVWGVDHVGSGHPLT